MHTHTSHVYIYIYTNINIKDVRIYIGSKSKLSSQNSLQNPQLQISFGTHLWFILWPFPWGIDCRSSFCQPVHVKRPWRIPSETEGLQEQTVCLCRNSCGIGTLNDQNRLRTLQDRTQSVEWGVQADIQSTAWSSGEAKSSSDLAHGM